VLDETGALAGFVTRSELVRAALSGSPSSATLAELGLRMPEVCHSDLTLREAAHLFAEWGVAVAPVVERSDPSRVVGLVSLTDLLEGRLRDLKEERVSERVLHFRDLLRIRRG
jgi:CBS domain-containing protein